MLLFAGENHHVKPTQADKRTEAAAQAFFTAAAFFPHAQRRHEGDKLNY